MTDKYEHSMAVKEEWLDDVMRETSEEDTLPKEEPSCDVTLKIFDEPYIPPVYSKVGGTVAISESKEEEGASATDGTISTEGDAYGHQYVSAETFDVGSFEQIGVAGRSRENFRNFRVEPGGDREGGKNKCVDTSLGDMPRASMVTHITCKYEADRTHNENHVGNEARPFACKMCNYASSSAYHLKRHMFGHSGEKPFACSYCDYKSHRADKVKRHARTHTGEKPFTCNHCNYRASRADHLKAHLRSHVGKGEGKHFRRMLD